METIWLQRSSTDVPWGFRLQGGNDFRIPLTVQRVTPGSVCYPQIQPGDVIIGIGNINAVNLTHVEAQDLIKTAGNMLQLTLVKGGSFLPSPMSPQSPQAMSPPQRTQQQVQVTHMNANGMQRQNSSGYSNYGMHNGMSQGILSPDGSVSDAFSVFSPAQSSSAQLMTSSTVISTQNAPESRNYDYDTTNSMQTPQVTRNLEWSPNTLESNRNTSSNSRVPPLWIPPGQQQSRNPVVGSPLDNEEFPPPPVWSPPVMSPNQGKMSPHVWSPPPAPQSQSYPVLSPPPGPSAPAPPPPPPMGGVQNNWREKQPDYHECNDMNGSKYNPSQHSTSEPGTNKPFSYIPDGIQNALGTKKGKDKPFSYLPSGITAEDIQEFKNRNRQDRKPPEVMPKSRNVRAPMNNPGATSPRRSTSPSVTNRQQYTPSKTYSPDSSFAGQTGYTPTGLSLPKPINTPNFKQSETLRLINESESHQPQRQISQEREEVFKNPSKMGMSFRVLQWLTDTETEEETESPNVTSPTAHRRNTDVGVHNAPDDEMHFSGLRGQESVPSRTFQKLRKLSINDESPAPPAQIHKPIHGPCTPLYSTEFDENRAIRTTKRIPSRAFQKLQRMTSQDSDDSGDIPPPRQKKEVPEVYEPGNYDETSIRYRGSNIPSRSFKKLQEVMGDSGDGQMQAGLQPGRQIRQVTSPRRQVPEATSASSPHQEQPKQSRSIKVIKLSSVAKPSSQPTTVADGATDF